MLEVDGSIITAMEEKLDSGPRLEDVRRFAFTAIGSLLAGDSELIASLWKQIGESTNPSDLTVLYCYIRYAGQSYRLLEFVAGESLEGLVKRSDPAACEREIPLFCRILDAFEGSSKPGNGEQVPATGLELADFGLVHARANLTSMMHGAVLTGQDGAWSEELFSEYGASRSQVLTALIELAKSLPAEPPKTIAKPAPTPVVNFVPVAEAHPVPAEPIAAVPKPGVRSVRLPKLAAHPYVIAAATALLILVALFGVGGFLAKRTLPADAGKLILPPIAAQPPEAPLEVPPPPETPQPLVTPPPTETVKAGPVRKIRSVRPPVTSIVVTRGARPIRQTSLQYPAEAKKERVSGTVEMQLTIAEDGTVRSPHVVSGDPLLQAGLTEEISKWVYEPMRVNGKPVPMTTELAIKFNLN